MASYARFAEVQMKCIECNSTHFKLCEAVQFIGCVRCASCERETTHDVRLVMIHPNESLLNSAA